MIEIGFEDQKKPTGNEEKQLSEEDVIRYQKTIEEAREKLYIPEKRLQKMMESYDNIVVHDFSDDYHMTEEERETKNKYYKMFSKLVRCKRKYRKIEEFIECARISLACLDMVVENLDVSPIQSYTPDKFRSLVFKGKINIDGWFFPVYRGKDRKQIDWGYLSEFILSDKPAIEMSWNYNRESKTDFMTSEEMNEFAQTLFDAGELESFMRDVTEADYIEYQVKGIDLEENPQLDTESSVVVVADRQHTKDLIKTAPAFSTRLKEIKRQIKSQQTLNKFVSDIHVADLEFIEEFDRKHNIESSSDVPEFHGNITNEDDYRAYLYQLQRWEETQTKVKYGGKLRTPQEINEISIKEALEDAGWNVRKLWGNAEIEKKLKKAAKADKKREEKLHKQLLRVQQRSKRRMDAYRDEEKTKKKKKDKKKKKKKEDA